jgi:hypothetical protein
VWAYTRLLLMVRLECKQAIIRPAQVTGIGR